MSEDELPPFDEGCSLLCNPHALDAATAGLSREMIITIGLLIYWFAELDLPMPLINGIECFWWPLDGLPDER